MYLNKLEPLNLVVEGIDPFSLLTALLNIRRVEWIPSSGEALWTAVEVHRRFEVWKKSPELGGRRDAGPECREFLEQLGLPISVLICHGKWWAINAAQFDAENGVEGSLGRAPISAVVTALTYLQNTSNADTRVLRDNLERERARRAAQSIEATAKKVHWASRVFSWPVAIGSGSFLVLEEFAILEAPTLVLPIFVGALFVACCCTVMRMFNGRPSKA